MPLLNRKRCALCCDCVQSTGCPRDNTLLEQYEVVDVFRIHSLALRASIRGCVGVGCQSRERVLSVIAVHIILMGVENYFGLG